MERANYNRYVFKYPKQEKQIKQLVSIICKDNPKAKKGVSFILTNLKCRLNKLNALKQNPRFKKKVGEFFDERLRFRKSPRHYVKTEETLKNHTIYKYLSYNDVKNAVNILLDKNIIKEEKGWIQFHWDWNVKGYVVDNSCQTYISLNTIEDWNLNIPDLKKYLNCITSFITLSFSRNTPEEYKEYKNFVKNHSAICKNKKYSFKGEPIEEFKTFVKENFDFDFETYKVWEAKSEYVKKTNEFNKYMDNLGYNKNFHFTRIFGENEDCYGRYYNRFTYIPKKLRHKIMEEYNLVELDYTSCSINILHNIMFGIDYPFDFYEDLLYNLSPDFKNNEVLKKLCRPMAKHIMQICLGCESMAHLKKSLNGFLAHVGILDHKKPSVLEKDPKTGKNYTTYDVFIWEKTIPKKWAEYCKQKNIPKGTPIVDFSIYNILTSLKIIFPNFLEIFAGTNCHFIVQNIESTAMTAIMEVMMRKGLPLLTIHDAILVPKEYKNIFQGIMTKEMKSAIKNKVDELNNLEKLVKKTHTLEKEIEDYTDMVAQYFLDEIIKNEKIDDIDLVDTSSSYNINTLCSLSSKFSQDMATSPLGEDISNFISNLEKNLFKKYSYKYYKLITLESTFIDFNFNLLFLKNENSYRKYININYFKEYNNTKISYYITDKIKSKFLTLIKEFKDSIFYKIYKFKLTKFKKILKILSITKDNLTKDNLTKDNLTKDILIKDSFINTSVLSPFLNYKLYINAIIINLTEIPFYTSGFL